MKRGIVLVLALAACSPEPGPLDGASFAETCAGPVAQSGKVDEREIEGFAVSTEGAGYVKVKTRQSSRVFQCESTLEMSVIGSEIGRPAKIASAG